MNSLRGVLALAAWLALGPAGAASQSAPTTTPLAPCDWTLTASSPVAMVHQGVVATYLSMGGQLMVTLGGPRGQMTGGTIILSGVSGAGVYPVPGGAPGGSGAGAVLLAERHSGNVVPLGSGSGDDLVYKGRVVGRYPPPARLTITHFAPPQIRGDLSGTFYDMTAVGRTPPMIVPVPVHVVFSAGDGFTPGSCP